MTSNDSRSNDSRSNDLGSNDPLLGGTYGVSENIAPAVAITQVEGVLFDLDGTLLDTASDLGGALNHVLRGLGKPEVSYEEFRLVASDGSVGLLKLGLGDLLQRYDIPQLRQQFLDYYENHVCDLTQPFAGVAETLEALNRADIPWGIVTNKPGKYTDLLLPHFAMFQQSKINISADTLPERKPHPLPLLHAAEVMGTLPAHTLYVGDAPRDIEAANAAGMPSIIAEYGYIDEEQDLSAWQATTQVKNLQDICQFLTR